jgi:septum formation protein
MQIVLASQSPYRKALLEALGLKFVCVRPEVDEEALKAAGPKDLVELTKYLSLAKAKSLVRTYPTAVIIGSDQVAELDGRRLDKPGTQENAEAQLQMMSGRSHRLITSLAVLAGGVERVETEITEIQFRQLEPSTIAAYVKQDNPIDCAGAYKIEKAGLSLIKRIDGDDPSAIQGLPMIKLVACLEDLGLSLNFLWSAK